MQLALNVDKSYVMAMGSAHGDVEVKYRGLPLRWTKDFRYLGL
jgi:hypothetical protein